MQTLLWCLCLSHHSDGQGFCLCVTGGWVAGHQSTLPSPSTHTYRATDTHMDRFSLFLWEEGITGQRWKASFCIGRPLLPTSWMTRHHLGKWLVEEKKKPLELGRSGLLRVTPPRPVTPLSRRAAANDQTSLVTNIFTLLHFKGFNLFILRGHSYMQ